MKPQKILFFTLFYLTTYLGISYLISYAWSLEIIFIELLVIGLFFSALLIVLLSFDISEKIADKLVKKPKIAVYNDEENDEIVEETFSPEEEEIFEKPVEEVKENDKQIQNVD